MRVSALHNVLVLGFVLLMVACSGLKSGKAKRYPFPNPVDTRTKSILAQEKKDYYFQQWDLSVDNLFDGARLSGVRAENDSVLHLIVKPENEPINPSPWYAFRITSAKEQSIYLKLDFGTYMHRYHPKVSYDRNTWVALDTTQITYASDSTGILFPFQFDTRPVWISAQEIVSSADVKAWCEQLEQHADVTFLQAGLSAMKKPLFMLDIGNEPDTSKPILVFLSRQHPPEVTGYFMLQNFLDRILENDSLAIAFRNTFRILVFPLLNPDGVDNGHWRHNAGGIDLNRDWAKYRQPETKQVANRIVQEQKKPKADVLLGIDFHSTWYDIYYTNTMVEGIQIPEFKDSWLAYIETNLENYAVNERASALGQPVTKGWFYTQFKAVGITYEIGDKTPRDFIRQKGIVSAEGMMKLLLEKNYRVKR